MNLDQRLAREAQIARIFLWLTVALGWAAGAATILQAKYLARTVGLTFLDGRTLADVQSLLVVLVGLAFARAGLQWAGEAAAFAVAARVKNELRERLFAHLMQLGPTYTRGERTGELTNTLTEGIEALEAYFSQYLPQLALAVVVPLTILCFVFPLDWLSALVLLLTAPLIPVFMALIGSLADTLTRRQWASLSRMSAHFLDVLQGLTTLKMFGRSREQIETIARVSDRFRLATMEVLRVAFLSALVLEMVATISTAIVAVQVGLRLLYGQVSFEQAFFLLILAPEFYLPLRLLGTRFHSGVSGVTAWRRIAQVLDTTADGSQPLAVAGPLSAVGGQSLAVARPPSAVEFHSVSYSYDGARAALDDVSFAIDPGQSVALVGPSGAGTSTVVFLLLGFIEPASGAIRVNGRDLREIEPAAWRDQVAWVPQNPYLFNATVAENIALARPHASRTEIERAAAHACADDFIRALPQGYDTLIGERGARLSGGQAQRLALARAFLKDAPFVIFDEATSNLDPETEELLQGAMGWLMRGRTALVIAHRLTTVYRADQIIVLDRGRVAESGSHASLVARNGLYATLVSASVKPDVHSQLPLTNYQSSSSNQQSEICNPQSAISTLHSPLSTPHSPFLFLLQTSAPFVGWMALAALLGFATVGSGIGLMATSAWLIASAALHPSIADLQVAIVGVRFFGIARGVLRYLERYVTHQVTFRLLARLRVWFYAAIEPLAPAGLQSYHAGDLLARAVADIETLQNFYGRVLAPPLVALFVGVTMWLWFAAFDPRLGAALAALLLAAGIGVPLLTHWCSRRPGRQVIVRRARLTGTLVDAIQGAADLIAFGQAGAWMERVRTEGRNLARAQTRLAWITGLHGALGTLLTGLSAAAILAVAIPLVTSGRLDGVLLAVLVLAAMACFESVLPLPLAALHYESSLQAAARLLDISAQSSVVVQALSAPQPNPPSEIRNPKSEIQSPQSAISIEDLDFRYAPTEPLALDGIDLHLAPGGRLVIVGGSGAGKSTLVNLLLRFWDYSQGSIRLQGRELSEIPPEQARACIGVVAQDTFLFNATIRENLLLARRDATLADLDRVARQAQLYDFIHTLPLGYDTCIGEQGLRLSGGERRRLAIARALLKDAPLLILDEPTANLDPVTERAVMEAIYTLMEGRATLLITHRLAGLDRMDEILVLSAGRILERGGHARLLQVGGIYRRMWDLQNQVIV